MRSNTDLLCFNIFTIMYGCVLNCQRKGFSRIGSERTFWKSCGSDVDVIDLSSGAEFAELGALLTS